MDRYEKKIILLVIFLVYITAYAKGAMDQKVRETDDREEKAKASIYLHFAYNAKGDLKKSLKYSKEALAIYEKQGDRLGIIDAMNALGMYYINIDYLDIAQDYLVKSLKICEELNNKDKLHTSYIHLGILYYNLEEFSKALAYYQKAQAIVKELKKPKSITCCFYTGLCYQKLRNYREALEYLQETRALAKNSGNQYYIGASLSNIGNVYVNLNQHQLALTYLFQALKIHDNEKYKKALVYTKYYIGNAYLKMKDYANALSYYNQTTKFAEELNDKKTLERLYQHYSDLYTDTGSYKKALDYYKLYSKTRESILTERKMKQIAELEIRFDTEKREKEIEILKKDNNIQKITRNASVIVLILLVVILILVFKKYLYLLAFWKTHKYISQYRVMEKIGSGGMGTVYLTHTANNKNQLAAVKVLKEELAEDKNNRRRFKQEGTIIDKLEHPHIVKIYERGEYEGKLYIAMEYLRGKTLAQKIKEEKKIDLQECFHIMIQITDALAFIHSKNVLHRDLKPANIMLIEKDYHSNFVKLLDFGVALMKFQTRLTQTDIRVGTIAFTAPEYITNNLYSPACDIYSLGMVFYEMLTGKSAFEAEILTAVVEKILRTSPREPGKLRPDIPGELNRLIMQMLSKVPAQRPPAANIVTTLKKIYYMGFKYLEKEETIQ